MSGVFPVGCGSAAPRENIIERRCLLRKYNKFFLIPLFFMMVFFIPLRCSAAVKETDAASSVSDSVKKKIKEAISSYDKTYCDYVHCSTHRTSIAHYLVYFYNGDKSKIAILYYPQASYYYFKTDGNGRNYLHIVEGGGVSTSFCRHHVWTVYNNTSSFDKYTGGLDGYDQHTDDYDYFSFLCRSADDILYSSCALFGKDGEDFFPSARFPTLVGGGQTLNPPARQAQRRILQTGKQIAIVIILVVSYLIFPIFWRKCLESLLPS